jgi:hypothetical protein
VGIVVAVFNVFGIGFGSCDCVFNALKGGKQFFDIDLFYFNLSDICD